MKTTSEWWNEIKSNPEALKHWLIRQYVGEMAAVNLLSNVLIRFGGDMNFAEWENVYSVMMQEAKHARWVKDILLSRNIPIPVGLDATRKYWEEVIPAVETLDDAAHAAHNAEHMRLERIRIIATETDPNYSDLQNVFKRILPDEEWHEEVFALLQRENINVKMNVAHDSGLQALSLVLS